MNISKQMDTIIRFRKEVLKSKIRKEIWNQIVECLKNKLISFSLYSVENRIRQRCSLLYYLSDKCFRKIHLVTVHNELEDIQIKDSPTIRKQC